MDNPQHGLEREQRILDACNKMASRMGCVFVKNERWPEMVAALRAILEARGSHDTQPCDDALVWRDMASAPRDGTMVWLLVDAGCPLADASRWATIGFNNHDHDGLGDKWLYIAWNWEQDCFHEHDSSVAKGAILAWLPIGLDLAQEGAVVGQAPNPNSRAALEAAGVAELRVQAETYQQMHETAKELGYPSILEALEAVAELRDALAAAQFLCERVRDFSHDVEEPDSNHVVRMFHGHVIPALSRLESRIATLNPRQNEEEGE